MPEQGSIEQYEFMRRVDALCDLIALAAQADATTWEELSQMLAPMLSALPPYHATLVPEVFPEFVSAVLKPKNRGAALAFATAMKRHLSDVSRAMAAGRPTVAVFGAATGEIFAALDLVPVSIEALSLIPSAVLRTGVEAEIDRSEVEGFPSHLCNMQRAPMSAIDDGTLPRFAAIVKATAPCNSSNMLYQYGLAKYGIPIITVDCPYYHNTRAFAYYLDEFRAMVTDLERMAGRALDEETLRTHVALGNEQMRYLYALQDLRKQRPNPDPGMHRAYDIVTLYHCGLNESYRDYMRTVYEEARTRHERGASLVPPDKREIRTLWTWGLTAHMLYMYDWLEDEFGSTFLECGISYVPSDLVGYVDPSSKDTMLEGLARRSMNFPMMRQVMGFSDVYVEDMVQAARDYAADAAVFSGNQSCKHAWAAAKRLSDALMDCPGIPSLTWETDLTDKRFTPHASTRMLLREFFSTFE